MKRLFCIVPLILALGLAAGCSRVRKQNQEAVISTRPSPEQQAAEALQLGQYDRVEEILAEVKSTPTAKVLLAEAKFQQGDLAQALSNAQEALGTKDAKAQNRAQAHEIMAKVAIRQNLWNQALDYLEQARRQYRHDEDLQRVADLTMLTRGLLAYSEGNVRQASEYWGSIQNPQLKLSISQYLEYPVRSES